MSRFVSIVAGLSATLLLTGCVYSGPAPIGPFTYMRNWSSGAAPIPAMAQQYGYTNSDAGAARVYGYDAQCRRLVPQNGMMVISEPQQECLDARTESIRARVEQSDAEEKRQAEAKRKAAEEQAARDRPRQEAAIAEQERPAVMPSMAQQDPYGFNKQKADLHQHYMDDLAEHFKNHIKSMNLMGRAAECKVIAGWLSDLSYSTFGDYANVLELQMRVLSPQDVDQILGAGYDRVQSDRAAYFAGIQDAKREGCDQFKNNPEWAFKLHNLSEHGQWLSF